MLENLSEQCIRRVGVKPGLWTLDWTAGLDRWTDSRFRACVGRSFMWSSSSDGLLSSVGAVDQQKRGGNTVGCRSAKQIIHT